MRGHRGAINLNPTASLSRLLSLSRAGYNSDADLEESCRFASLIYFSALVRNIPFNSYLNKDTLDLLRMTLGRSVLGGWDRAPGLLHWVLLVGTAAEKGQDEIFFAVYLRTTGLWGGVILFEDVKSMLLKLLWIERIVQGRAKRTTLCG